MKQTAVELLIEKIEWHTGLKYLYEEDYVIKAKELEKQQIIDANNDGYKVGRKTKKFETAEQYYHETFTKPARIANDNINVTNK